MGRKGRSPCCDKTKVKRGSWSPAEDAVLVSFIKEHGHSNWRALPEQAGNLQNSNSSLFLSVFSSPSSMEIQHFFFSFFYEFFIHVFSVHSIPDQKERKKKKVYLGKCEICFTVLTSLSLFPPLL